MYLIKYTEDALGDLESFRKSERQLIPDEIDHQLTFEPALRPRTESAFAQISWASGSCELGNIEYSTT